MFGSGRHAVLLQEEHGHGTLKTFHAAKAINARLCELRECLVPMKSALSHKYQLTKSETKTGQYNLVIDHPSSKKTDQDSLFFPTAQKR